ncbi:MAG TPA: hypothetical protein VHM70_19970 [Polyangiaceae bacterium]|jgi:hypothetical protein|nr:hypothetical protein [Polyangiaceae bacterium]
MTVCRTGSLRGFALAAAFAFLASGTRAEQADAALLSHLPSAKHGLREALEAVLAEGAEPISAKLEFEEGRLWLSVYGAKEGLHKCAEKNELFELKGDATAEHWQPQREIFSDREHLTRASAQLTLMQTTNLTLEAALTHAALPGKSVVYSAIPSLKDGKTAIVIEALVNGKPVQILVDETTK